ncbi:MAG: S8 family serine peptidase [Pyrinomonadaceae bacterium]
MPESIFPNGSSSDDCIPFGADDLCSVCGRLRDDDGAALASLDENLQNLIRSNAADGEIEQVCRRCVELFERAQVQLETDAAVFEQGGHVLSTPLRLDTDDRFTGRGVTIAFLDSGFYPHADLTTPVNRILAYHNIAEKDGDHTALDKPNVASWHGMMTSVVAAGNGSLSNGFYRGIAPEANVVLIKLAKTGRVSEKNIQDGLEWVLAHREQYQIKVVNISAGGDFEQPYLHNELCRVVERVVSAGLVVVCAVGNAGHAPGHPVLPPAASPSSIAVGGLDDNNSLNRTRRGMYRSSYGPTIDGLQKPEVIAPGIWVPAPILPDTPTSEQAILLATLDNTPDDEIHTVLAAHPGVDQDLDSQRFMPVYFLRQLITLKMREENVITPHYKYVDGTSFSAPIVSSTIACLLEANPKLAPHQVKRILIDTSERLPGIEIDRQGWGVINPRRAVELALATKGKR